MTGETLLEMNRLVCCHRTIPRVTAYLPASTFQESALLLKQEKWIQTNWHQQEGKNESVGGSSMAFSGCWFFRKRKLSAVSHNPVTPAIVNIDCRIRAVSSLARLTELILSDFLFLHGVWIHAPVCAPLLFPALSIRTKRMTHQSSAVPNVKFTSRGTRAARRWCARTANTPSAGTVWSPWMWVES